MRTVVALLVLIAACNAVPTEGPSFVPNADGVVIIQNSPGGNVQHFLNERDKLERMGLPVEIRGFCNSSCAIFYSLPTACLRPGARLGFHTASNDPTGHYERMIRNQFRAGIRDMYWSEWRHSEEIVSINRDEAMALDPEIVACEDR